MLASSYGQATSRDPKPVTNAYINGISLYAALQTYRYVVLATLWAAMAPLAGLLVDLVFVPAHVWIDTQPLLFTHNHIGLGLLLLKVRRCCIAGRTADAWLLPAPAP